MLPLILLSQEVRDVSFKQVGKKIHIYYDLVGDGVYSTDVYCSEDGGTTWGKPLVHVSGDVWKNQKPGVNKEVVWDVLKERENLMGEILFKIKVENVYEIDMVFVKGGTFTMGSPTSEAFKFGDETQHLVTLSDFYIGKYEVTQKQWKEIMGSNPSAFSGCDNCPVEQVSWNDVQEFIKKLNQKTGKNYRLPTEAEWEFAARGGNQSKGTIYSGSNNIDEVAWDNNNSGNKSHPVGMKKANELGLYDMSGNVWEWCNDWYEEYPSGSQTNPKGPSSGTLRVLRGGSWDYRTQFCRSARRNNFNPDKHVNYFGFRMAASAP